MAREGNVIKLDSVLQHREHNLIETRDDEGKTPLFVAVECWQDSAGLVLLKKGANYDFRLSVSVFELVCCHGLIQCARYIIRAEEMQYRNMSLGEQLAYPCKFEYTNDMYTDSLSDLFAFFVTLTKITIRLETKVSTPQ